MITTGWPPGMLQDDCRGLSRWLSNKLDARYVLRKNLVMKTKTSELIGPALDWAVAYALVVESQAHCQTCDMGW